MKELGFMQLRQLGLLDHDPQWAEKVCALLEEGTYTREEAVSLAFFFARQRSGYELPFTVSGFRTVEVHPSTREAAEVVIKIAYKGPEDHIAGKGDGSINALDNALRKVLPVPHLVLGDYHVDMCHDGAETGSASRVKVVIDWTINDWHFRTAARAKSVVEASWLAMVDAFELAILVGPEF